MREGKGVGREEEMTDARGFKKVDSGDMDPQEVARQYKTYMIDM